jgi:hypothetical protein
VSAYLVAVSYATMALAGLMVGLLFRALGRTPVNRQVTVFESTVAWNYNTVLDIAFLALTALLLLRFLRTGGVAMLRAMGHPADAQDHAAMAHHH